MATVSHFIYSRLLCMKISNNLIGEKYNIFANHFQNWIGWIYFSNFCSICRLLPFHLDTAQNFRNFFYRQLQSQTECICKSFHSPPLRSIDFFAIKLKSFMLKLFIVIFMFNRYFLITGETFYFIWKWEFKILPSEKIYVSYTYTFNRKCMKKSEEK